MNLMGHMAHVIPLNIRSITACPSIFQNSNFEVSVTVHLNSVIFGHSSESSSGIIPFRVWTSIEIDCGVESNSVSGDFKGCDW